MSTKVMNVSMASDEIFTVKVPGTSRLVPFKAMRGDDRKILTIFVQYTNLRGVVRGKAFTDVVDQESSVKPILAEWEHSAVYDYKSMSLWEKYSDMARIDDVLDTNQRLVHYFVEDDCTVRFRAFSNDTDSYYDVVNAATRFPTLSKLKHVVINDDRKIELLD